MCVYMMFDLCKAIAVNTSSPWCMLVVGLLHLTTLSASDEPPRGHGAGQEPSCCKSSPDNHNITGTATPKVAMTCSSDVPDCPSRARRRLATSYPILLLCCCGKDVRSFENVRVFASSSHYSVHVPSVAAKFTSEATDDHVAWLDDSRQDNHVRRCQNLP